MKTFLTLILFLSFCTVVKADLKIEPSPLWNAVNNPELGILSSNDNFGGWKEDKSTSDSSASNIHLGKKKSVIKAGVLSALIPGAGEYYLGNRKKARYFFATEIVTWLGYFSLHTYANWKQDDLVNYAAVHANAQLEGKSQEFIDIVGFYDNIDEYNVQGRIIEPDRPYLPDTEENHWAWDSKESRDTYKEIKSAGRDAERRANIMIGLAVVSRVLSVIDAVRDAHIINKRVGRFSSNLNQKKLELSINPTNKYNQVKLTLHTGF